MDSRCPFSPLHLHSHPKERVICRRKHANEGFLGSGTVAATRLHSHHPIGYSVFGRALSTPFVESRSNQDPPWVDKGCGHCVDYDLLEGGTPNLANRILNGIHTFQYHRPCRTRIRRFRGLDAQSGRATAGTMAYSYSVQRQNQHKQLVYCCTVLVSYRSWRGRIQQ